MSRIEELAISISVDPDEQSEAGFDHPRKGHSHRGGPTKLSFNPSKYLKMVGLQIYLMPGGYQNADDQSDTGSGHHPKGHSHQGPTELSSTPSNILEMMSLQVCLPALER
jgi:hypothetical protein